jgi:hypothetical protein
MKLAFSPRVMRKQEHPSPTLEPANLGSPSGVILRTLLIFIFSQIVAVFAVGLVYGLYHHGKSVNLNDSVIAEFFYILIAEGLAAWLAIWLVRRRRLSLKVIGGQC